MGFGNDVLLILLLSILSTPADDNGEVDFSSNTNFLLLLLLVLQNSRTLDSFNSCLCSNGINCFNNCCGSCNSGNNCSECSVCRGNRI
jgi:hypothetical protein